jgi:hypothetical protein
MKNGKYFHKSKALRLADFDCRGKGQIGVVVLGNIPVHREGLEAKKNAIIDKTSVSLNPPFRT